MTPDTLQALRRLLFFTRAEAARYLAASDVRPLGVSERTWGYWECGRVPVPEDVARRVRELVDWRQRAIDATIAQIDALREQHGEPREIILAWYPTLNKWLARSEGEPPIYWRPHCSVVAAVAAARPVVVVSAP